jgi:hypothetical protein
MAKIANPNASPNHKLIVLMRWLGTEGEAMFVVSIEK